MTTAQAANKTLSFHLRLDDPALDILALSSGFGPGAA
jgi:hypothetical protein